MLKVTFDPSVPIYTQIVDRFRREICSGARQPGERIEPVRELAGTLGVNPNTLQRALGELEREGLVYAERTAGRFVTQDTERIFAVQKELSRTMVRDFVMKMRALGCTLEQILELVGQEMASMEGEQQDADGTQDR